MKHGWKRLIAHYKSEEHWYIKYLTWGIVGIVCFAILIHILKEVDIVPAQNIFDFFNEWATILYAGVTLLLVGVAVWTITDNRYSRMLEKRERLLNEIIQWAENVAESAVTRQTLKPDELWKTKLKYKYSKAKSKYVTEIVSSSFKELSPFVENVNSKLEEAIDAATQFIERRQQAGDKLVNYEIELTESVEELLTEAAKIKTNDIGREGEENMSKENEATVSNEPTLKDIAEHLRRIEGHVIQSKKDAKAQAVGSLGFTGMAVGLTLIIATSQGGLLELRTGLFVFFAGLAISLPSLVYSYRKKS